MREGHRPDRRQQRRGQRGHRDRLVLRAEEVVRVDRPLYRGAEEEQREEDRRRHGHVDAHPRAEERLRPEVEHARLRPDQQPQQRLVAPIQRKRET